MKRERTIRAQMASLGMLADAVGAMKSLSAHHLRLARAELQSARAYRTGVDDLLASIGLAQAAPESGPVAILLFGADLGLCDGYNQRLVGVAVHQREEAPGPTYCVGRRSLAGLRRAGVEAARSYSAATSVDGVPRLLLSVADDVLGDYLADIFGRLVVVSARFDGVGVFSPVVTTVLPVDPDVGHVAPVATPYASASVLRRTAIREYLYSTLYELLIDALASEHGARLVATGSAAGWLDERIHTLSRNLAAVRQEAGTQEVLDVASAARLRRRRVGGG